MSELIELIKIDKSCQPVCWIGKFLRGQFFPMVTCLTTGLQECYVQSPLALNFMPPKPCKGHHPLLSWQMQVFSMRISHGIICLTNIVLTRPDSKTNWVD